MQPSPSQPAQANRLARRVAAITLVAGLGIMALKLVIFYLTGSAAVLTDALESIINLLAAGVMWYALWLSGQPADREHPYGHGKVEFMTLGLEGGMILIASLMIGFVAIQRLIHPVELSRLDLGTLMLLGGECAQCDSGGICLCCGPTPAQSRADRRRQTSFHGCGDDSGGGDRSGAGSANRD